MLSVNNSWVESLLLIEEEEDKKALVPGGFELEEPLGYETVALTTSPPPLPQHY